MIFGLTIILIILIILIIWIWYNPEYIFNPINFLYKMDTSPRTNFYTENEKNLIFPVGNILESKWREIKDEGYYLYELLPDKTINYLNNYNIDLGEENKKQWTTIPLRLFGRDYFDYINKCPVLGDILLAHREIKSCLFSIMQPGKIIKPHIGPYDGLIRYQLALDIPDIDLKSSNISLNFPDASIPDPQFQHCYLYVDNEKYYWKEGEGILFDESNLHGAVNTTTKMRMVLLIDIERPYNYLFYRIINKIVVNCMGFLS